MFRRSTQIWPTNASISKSDFKLGLSCPFKLLYRKQGLRTLKSDDPMLEFLAEGGFMVEALAHAVLSDQPNCEFEPTISDGRFHARVDALIDDGGQGLRLIEIKSIGVDGSSPNQFTNSKGEYKSDRLEYLYDITFQVMVARAAFPGRPVRAFLCCVDKTKTASDANIFENIELIPRLSGDDLSNPRAIYRGDPQRVRDDHLLAFIDVTEIVEDLMPTVRNDAKWLLEWLDGKHKHEAPPVSKSLCKSCEFRSAPNGDQGFSNCWGTDGAEPMIIDIYGAPNANLKKRIEQLSGQGKVGLQHLTDADVEGSQKTDLIRQRQLTAFKTNAEVFEPDGAQDLMSITYPLAFFDIETSRVPLPYAPGMKPYQQSVFQFSVHILRTPSSTDLEHYEWLDLDHRYPNANFIEKLMPVLGDHGTVFMWSKFEQTALRDVKEQLLSLSQLSDSAADWIDRLAGVKSKGGVNERQRLFDLNEISKTSYAHPLMNGSHSIKKVLDAVWAENQKLWTNGWFEKYLERDETGAAVDPYKVLVSQHRRRQNSPFIEIDVNDGVAAMRAYQSLMFGPHRNDGSYAEGLRNALLAYCELDTAAMVMIWLHFSELLKAA